MYVPFNNAVAFPETTNVPDEIDEYAPKVEEVSTSPEGLVNVTVNVRFPAVALFTVGALGGEHITTLDVFTAEYPSAPRERILNVYNTPVNPDITNDDEGSISVHDEPPSIE